MQKRTLLPTILIILIAFPSTLYLWKVEAYGTARLYASPSTRVAQVDETYTFDVRLENATQVTVIAFSLSFDTSKLNVTKIELGNALPGGFLLIGGGPLGYIYAITVVGPMGVPIDVGNKTAVRITVETCGFTGPEGTLIDLWGMDCWDINMNQFLQGDCPFDHRAVIMRPLVVGVMGPMTWSQGQGMKEGAEVAKEEINGAGGILGMAVKLVYADTLRGSQYPSSSTGTAAARELLNANCDFAIGGYWNSSVYAAREVFMDNGTIFAVTGSFDDNLMNAVNTNYARYKYLFRVAPNNFTMQAQALWNFTRDALASKLVRIFGTCLWPGAPNNQTKVAVISENLTIWDNMHQKMTNSSVYPNPDVLGPYANVTYSARVSPDRTNFTDILLGINASEARLIINLFSTQSSINFVKQWKELGIKAVLIGIDMESPNDMFWQATGEECESETTVSESGTETPLDPCSLEFADRTRSKYDHAPMSAAFGTYDAIYTLKEAIERANATSSDAVVTELEKTDRNCTRGRFKFTANHDVFSNEAGTHWTYGYVRPFVVQWRTDALHGGRLDVVSPKFEKAMPFTRKWSIPTWIDEIGDTDVTGNGEVDIYDAIALSQSWGKKVGDLGYNPECDIDGNGIVDIADASGLGSNFGKSRSYLRTSKLAIASLNFGITQTNLDTRIYIDPPTINVTEEDINSIITVNVSIINAFEVYSWQAGLTFNATLLNCIGVHIGDFLEGRGAPLLTSYTGTIDSFSGNIERFGSSLTGPFNASGNGRLMYVDFKVKASGVSNIHLRDVKAMSAEAVYQMVPFDIIDQYTVTQYAPWTVSIVSNSTGVENIPPEYIGSGFSDHDFKLPDDTLSFNVTGPYPGHLNATIPKSLISVPHPDQLLVVVNGTPLKTHERTVIEYGDKYYVYFNYSERPNSIQILKRPPVYNVDANLYYSTIQEAINKASEASPQQTILVFAGTRYENVVVNKTVALVGENKYNTTIDGRARGTVIKVTAENVKISDLTIRNSSSFSCGILVDESSSSDISHNIITGNYYGMLINYSSYNQLADNNMTSNKYNFGVYGDQYADFFNDIDATNLVDGRPVCYTRFEDGTTYDLSDNIGALYLIECENINVKDLVLKNNTHGIFLYKTKNSHIENFTALDNAIGIFLSNSNDNTIYHNSFIKNTIHAKATESYYNTWDDGYPNGGNYWSDYSDTDFYHGPSQDQIGNDGIIDHKYTIDANNSDNYPLTSPLAPPVYNIASNLGYAKIQDAINAVQTSNSHTIIVRNGTYNERLTINKSVTLVGLDGITIINASGATAAITINANNVIFRDFTLQGNASTDKAILVSSANNTDVRENVINRGLWGIYLNRSYGCYIGGNLISNLTSNNDGIRLEYSSNNTVSRNNLTDSYYGIHLRESSFNIIQRDNIKNNTCGIFLDTSDNNKIYHNNFMNNTNQALVSTSSNAWDNGSRGNYWSDYGGMDNNHDGIGDTPYVIDSNNRDNYPLMNPRIPEHDIAVVSVAPSKTAVGQNFTVSIYATVENQGEYTEMFDLTLTNPSTRKATALLAESSMLYTFVWNTNISYWGNYTISADVTHLAGETDTLDNNSTYGLITVTYPGDFCLPGKLPDFKVGPADFAYLSASYGSTPGKSIWNPNCDVNDDNKVGPADFAWLSKNFGQPK